MNRIIVLFSAMSVLSGCQSVRFAGESSYQIKPIIDPVSQAVICCAVSINSGKEFASVNAHVQKEGNKISVDLEEKGVTAFQGQAIASGASKNALDAVAQAALSSALVPSVVAAARSGTAGAVVGGAAAGITADRLLTPAISAAVPPTPAVSMPPTAQPGASVQ